MPPGPVREPPGHRRGPRSRQVHGEQRADDARRQAERRPRSTGTSGSCTRSRMRPSARTRSGRAAAGRCPPGCPPASATARAAAAARREDRCRGSSAANATAQPSASAPTPASATRQPPCSASTPAMTRPPRPPMALPAMYRPMARPRSLPRDLFREVGHRRGGHPGEREPLEHADRDERGQRRGERREQAEHRRGEHRGDHHRAAAEHLRQRADRDDRQRERGRSRRHRQARRRGADVERARQLRQQRLRRVQQRERGQAGGEQPEPDPPHSRVVVPQPLRSLHRHRHVVDAKPDPAHSSMSRLEAELGVALFTRPRPRLPGRRPRHATAALMSDLWMPPRQRHRPPRCPTPSDWSARSAAACPSAGSSPTPMCSPPSPTTRRSGRRPAGPSRGCARVRRTRCATWCGPARSSARQWCRAARAPGCPAVPTPPMTAWYSTCPGWTGCSTSTGTT